ncbi:MAG TPA: NADH-quinone oxidoreductase subunit N [Acidimicrobiales bacterium]
MIPFLALLAQLGQAEPVPVPEGGGLGPLRTPPMAYADIGPMIALTVGALVLLTYAALVRRKPGRGVYALFTLLTCAVALGASAWLWLDLGKKAPRFAFANMIAVDGFAVFFYVVIAIAVALAALLADGYLRRERLDGPEFYVLALLSGAGGMLMASANDLIVVFLGLETLTISLFVLAGFHRRRAQSGEAAMKYFVLAAFSSAFLLYGIALVYGATGTTNLAGIATWLAENVVVDSGVLLAGIALLLVGFGFKVAAVPFHTWTPDVYEGSPTPVTAFMAGASKAAGFAAFLRVFFSTFHTVNLDWKPLVWTLAVLSLVVGSVLAIVQRDVKRMLAYSSISHAGYVLIGLEAASDRGIAGSLFYLLAYTFMVMGSFAIVTIVSRRGDNATSLDDFRGLSERRPALALAMTILLMAQAGVPFTSGFLAKFHVIAAAVEQESYALALIAMLAAVVAAFFYLRLVLAMYSPALDADDVAGESTAVEGAGDTRLPVPFSAALALVATVGFTLLAGFPVASGPFFEFAREATLLF